MTVSDLEQVVLELEQVRIVVRASARSLVDDYNYLRMAAGNARVSEWLAQRILPLMQGSEVVVLDGTGRTAHGRTLMSTLRQTYER